MSNVTDMGVSSKFLPIPEPVALLEDQKQRLWSSIVVGYYPTANATAIEALIGAGNLDMITDKAMRQNIQEYRNTAIALRGSQADTIKAFRTIAVQAGQERGFSPFYRSSEQKFMERVIDDEHLLAVIATQREYAVLHLRLIESLDADAKELLAQIQALK